MRRFFQGCQRPEFLMRWKAWRLFFYRDHNPAAGPGWIDDRYCIYAQFGPVWMVWTYRYVPYMKEVRGC